MLEKIEQLSIDTSNIIIYTNSAILQNVLKTKIKERFGIARNLTKYADSSTSLKQAKNETFLPPFGGGIWLVDVQCDKISLSDLAKQLNQVTKSSITVYWTDKYMQFKSLCDLETVKRQGAYCFNLYAGKLYPEDITYLYNSMIIGENKLAKELLDYLKKNYTFNVNAVCELFSMVMQGEKIHTTKDIVNLVGMGGNTVDSFVLKLLTSNPKTEKGIKKSLEKMIILLNDLSYSYDYNSIKKFMKNTIDTILQMKQLQVMGKYTRNIKNIPDVGFNEDKINRLKRFEGSILEDINIARVLQLKLLFSQYTNYNSQIALIEIISAYLSYILNCNINNPESKENLVRKRRRKI